MLAAACAAAGPATVRESRPVGPVERVEFGATGELTIRQGAAEALAVEAEPRVLPRIRTTTAGGTLTIAIDGPLQTQAPIRFELSVRSLAAVALTGSGSVEIGPLDTPALTVRLAGSGEAKLAALTARELTVRIDGSGDVRVAGGAVGRQRIEIDGAGGYDASALRSDDATVAIRGSGDVRLRAERKVDAEISGAGDVTVAGNASVTERIAGAGSVKRQKH